MLSVCNPNRNVTPNHLKSVNNDLTAIWYRHFGQNHMLLGKTICQCVMAGLRFVLQYLEQVQIDKTHISYIVCRTLVPERDFDQHHAKFTQVNLTVCIWYLWQKICELAMEMFTSDTMCSYSHLIVGKSKCISMFLSQHCMCTISHTHTRRLILMV